ncbi:MAG TPA: UvrD-helicase domain-containing protein, partial [Xanthomonadales bacterium]|nr:UvrD-helicase domain-containing protein [Xanthomonadales bacterium]
MSRPADFKQRSEALDLARSFIVQAPAGSGKTELLTQRFLKLLAQVDRPERILAITFTRKATREMRDRIMKRLRQAQTGETGVAEHEQLAVTLAAKALKQVAKNNWNLLQTPGRMRVYTIDGLCSL